MTQIEYVTLAYITAALIFSGAALSLWCYQCQLQHLANTLADDDL